MMRFTKMHGAGNDYVYVNCFVQPIPADGADGYPEGLHPTPPDSAARAQRGP